MRILGIDPGLANTGYGIIDHDRQSSRLVISGCVVTPAGAAMPTRLQRIHDDLARIIEEWKPDTAAIEQLYFSKNVTTAITVAQGRGVAILAMAKSNLPMFEYTPLQIKQAVTGSGKADKAQVTRMVRALLGPGAEGDKSPATNHAADALAVALCHAHCHRFHEMTAAALSAAQPGAAAARKPLSKPR